MKPLRSKSRERDFVSGECGEPAKTTTSVLDPFFALFALLFMRSARRRRHITNTPVPMKATTAAVTARCSETHRWAVPRELTGSIRCGGAGGGGDGSGLSYSHGEFCMASLMEAATGYSRRVEATALKCLSIDSVMRFTSPDIESRSGTIFSKERRVFSRVSSLLEGIVGLKYERSSKGAN